MEREIVMYTRQLGCPYIRIAKRIFKNTGVHYREVFVDRDEAAGARLLDWVGFLSVPTLVIAEPGADLPLADPDPLPEDATSARGIDRGTMLTEPSAAQLTAWLVKNGFLEEENQ